MKHPYFTSIKVIGLFLSACAMLLGSSSARAGVIGTVWLWRQPPSEPSNSGGYVYTIPAVQVAAWGGTNDNVIYAGNADEAHETKIPNGVYRSKDYGLTWEYLGSVDEKENITALVVHPTKPNIVAAGFNRTYYQAGIYRSEDSGGTWSSVLPYLTVYDIEVDPHNPSVWYTTGRESGVPSPTRGGTYKSTDAGKTWEYISTAIYSDLAVSPAASNVIFGASGFTLNPAEGIYRSEDSGVTWTQISGVRQRKIVINPQKPNEMFIFGESYQGIWRTTDGGENWTLVNNNLPRLIADHTVQLGFFDRDDPNTIWVGLKYGGMYVSHNNGASWQEQSEGLPYLGQGIYGPQCTAADVSRSGRIMVNCDGRLFVRTEKISTTFLSNGTDDGWVLEESEFKQEGGTLDDRAGVLLLGDDDLDRQYRAVLSFDTSSLPGKAVITKVRLKVKLQGINGTNPLETHGALLVDIAKVPFGGVRALEIEDFQAPASKSSIGRMPLAPVNGWYTRIWTDGIFSYINKNGLTQFRLRFQQDDNDDKSADSLKFYSGNAVRAVRPVLIIEYFVP